MTIEKQAYLRALVLLDDISNYHQSINGEQDLHKKLRLFKNCFIALDILRDSFSNFNFIIKKSEYLIKTSRSLKKRLLFINHIRNKISGHLDNNLLEKAVQWEPHIFSIELKGERLFQLLLTYKSILESGINSYIDNESNHKIFNTEIDLAYPPNQTLFNNFIGELNSDSISFLEVIIKDIELKIDFHGVEKLMEEGLKAGITDFKL